MLLRRLLAEPTPDMEGIEAQLDALGHAARLAEVTSLGKKEQAILFDAAQGFRVVELLDFVPEGKPPLTGVVHHGKNSLPLFNRFAKVFCRPDGDAPEGELWGYNRSSALVETTVGPGYFVAGLRPEHGDILVDYLRLPPRHPEGWPPILPNEARLSRFVYNGTQDAVRKVSRHVSVGRASRAGRDLPNWFVLCRED